MARPRKKKPLTDHLLIKEEPKTEWQKAVAHLEENYKLYIAGAIFLLLLVAIGALIRMSAVIGEREKATRYAEAALIEDPQERLERYKEVLDSLGRWTPEALYRMGETAIQVEQYDVAAEAFRRLQEEYPDSTYVPNAIDGLAFVAWNRGDLEAALDGFERIVEHWSGEFIARRKFYDIGRVLEEMERFEDAAGAYQQQLQVFPESAIARRAQRALDELAQAHPELFPEPEPEEDLLVDVDLDDEVSEAPLETDAPVIVLEDMELPDDDAIEEAVDDELDAEVSEEVSDDVEDEVTEEVVDEDADMPADDADDSAEATPETEDEPVDNAAVDDGDTEDHDEEEPDTEDTPDADVEADPSEE